MKPFCEEIEEVKCGVIEASYKKRRRKFPWLPNYQASKFRKRTLERKQECLSKTIETSLFSKIPVDLLKTVLMYLTDDELFNFRKLNSVFYEVYFCQSPKTVPQCNGYGRPTCQVSRASDGAAVKKKISFNYTRAISLARKGRRFPQARHIVAVFGLQENRNPALWMSCLNETHFPQLRRLILCPPRKQALGNNQPPSPQLHPQILYLELREAYPQYIAHSLKVYPNLKVLKARVQIWGSSIDWEIISDNKYSVFFSLKEIVIEIRGWQRYQNWGVFNSVRFPNLERLTIHELDLHSMRVSYPALFEIYEEILRQEINILEKQKFKLDFQILGDHNQCNFFAFSMQTPVSFRTETLV